MVVQASNGKKLKPVHRISKTLIHMTYQLRIGESQDFLIFREIVQDSMEVLNLVHPHHLDEEKALKHGDIHNGCTKFRAVKVTMIGVGITLTQ